MWEPHDAQVMIGSPLITGEVNEVFAQCGRNLGKTAIVCYLLWRYAASFPGSENYYFAPYMKQAREIIWATNRIQSQGPKRWIASVNNTEMRIVFTNGSFIKCDGSDNVEAYRGVKPRGLSVFDEFKDFKPEFYEAYDPNRAAHNSPLLIVGTPPDEEGLFTKVADNFKVSPNKRFIKAPSSANPHLSREWLEAKKAELYARGDGDQWEREYEANFVKGGSKRIFPMFNDSFVKPYDQVLSLIARDKRKLEWFIWTDPAAASVFGALFAALNPYTKTWYFLDEIYESKQEEMTVKRIGKRILNTRDTLFIDRYNKWRQGYDEAETWFANEMLDHFGEHFEPTQKMRNNKLQGITLLKDAFLQNKVVITDRCKNFVWELERYKKDDNGKIEKKEDHLIDCARYCLAAANYTLNEEREPIESKQDDFRGARLEDDFPQIKEWGNKYL